MHLASLPVAHRQFQIRKPAGPGPQAPAGAGSARALSYARPFTMDSVIFFASPNSIMVFGRKNNSLSTPA